MDSALAGGASVIGALAVFGGAELFAEHLHAAAARLRVSAFALGVLLAGAEPEELATVVAASVRDAPGIALGDVVGANVALALLPIGCAALLAPLRISRRTRRYAYAAFPLGVLALAFAWDGRVARLEGALLVVLYLAYVATIWRLERTPPRIGELAEAGPDARRNGAVGRDLLLTVGGVALLAAGSVAIVEGVKELADTEGGEVAVGVTVVGFATAFELVVLAWSATRRGRPDVALAGVVGSFAYNATMTLGAGALTAPIALADASLLRLPLVWMPIALALPFSFARGDAPLRRLHGAALVAAYVEFVVASIAVIRSR